MKMSAVSWTHSTENVVLDVLVRVQISNRDLGMGVYL